MIGYPKYKEDDHVGFLIDGRKEFGYVYIVDEYGTFEQNEEPSYDIVVRNWKGTGTSCLFKHIRESDIIECETEE